MPDDQVTPDALRMRKLYAARKAATGLTCPPRPGRRPKSEDGIVSAHARYMRMYRGGLKSRSPFRRSIEQIFEQPGLKPALTGEYHKCGFPELPLEAYAEELRRACIDFWKRRGLSEPVSVGYGSASWDWEWIDKAVAT